MKYLPCSLLLFRFLTWDSLEPRGLVIFIIWSLMRLETLVFYSTSDLNFFLFKFSLWLPPLQFVSPSHFSHIYSEKLVHLPHCYFVNDYKQVSHSYFSFFWFFFFSFFLHIISTPWYILDSSFCVAFVRKISMYWILTAKQRDRIMAYQRTNLSLHVSISCTRWILTFSIHGNFG